MCKISVIVPVYNAEKYLDRCVESILSQTFTDFELLLVDDGSPDSCPAMCDAWAQKDSRIRVIHKQNGGVSDARNAGLEQAKGEYITFMDNDDYALTTWLECMYRASAGEAEIVKGGFYSVSNTQPQHLVSDAGLPVLEQRDLRSEIKSTADFIHYMAMDWGNGCDAVWNQLVKKQLFEGVRFPVGKLSEDFDVCFKLCRKTDKLAVLPQSGYCWVSVAESQSNNISPEKMIQHICVRKECLEYLWSVGDREASASLCRQLWSFFRAAFPAVSGEFVKSADYGQAVLHFRANSGRYTAALDPVDKMLFTVWRFAPGVLSKLLKYYRR